MRETTVTIKYGKGYEESWAVFKGSPVEVREDIIDYFGLPRESVAGAMTLHQLVTTVTQIAHGTNTAAASLGAVSIAAPSTTTTAAPAQSAPAASNEDPWDLAARQADKMDSARGGSPTENPMLQRIADCKTTDDLRKLWATNQAAFSDSGVMDAWKARGRALKAA